MKVGQLTETLVALFDILERHAGQSLYTKILDGKRRDHGSVHNGPTDAFLTVIVRASQLTHESAGKGISGTCRIEDFFKRIGRCCNDPQIPKLQHAVST